MTRVTNIGRRKDRVHAASSWDAIKATAAEAKADAKADAGAAADTGTGTDTAAVGAAGRGKFSTIGRKRGDVAPVIPVGHEIEAGEAPSEAGGAEAPKPTIRVKRAVATGAVATKDAKGTGGPAGAQSKHRLPVLDAKRSADAIDSGSEDEELAVKRQLAIDRKNNKKPRHAAAAAAPKKKKVVYF